MTIARQGKYITTTRGSVEETEEIRITNNDGSTISTAILTFEINERYLGNPSSIISVRKGSTGIFIKTTTDADTGQGVHWANIKAIENGENAVFLEVHVLVQDENETNIPVDPNQIIRSMQLADSIDREQIITSIQRAQDRAEYLMGEATDYLEEDYLRHQRLASYHSEDGQFINYKQRVSAWVGRNYGWPRRVSNWTTKLAEKYLSKELYVGREESFDDEIRSIEDMLAHVSFDIDGDGFAEVQTRGKSFRINRLST